MKPFNQYDNENPKIWEAFKKFTLQAIRSGKEHYSSKSIFERIRWETAIEAQNDSFKLNNNYTGDYSRKFMESFPQYKGFFRTREMKKVC